MTMGIPDESEARSGIYRLLARIWRNEADRQLLQQLRTPPLRDLFVDAGGALPTSDSEQMVEDLAIEYCQLFVGPKNHLPPFQSVWQKGQFQSEASASMKTFVEIVGGDLGSFQSGGMLDHLGIQLDVMGRILAEAATSRSDPQRLTQCLELGEAFFARHLTWPSELLETARQRTGSDFYRSIIEITRQFLHSEEQTVPRRSPE